MKKIALATITLLLSLSALAQQAAGLTANNINGKVKELREETCFVMVDTVGKETHILREATLSTYSKEGLLKQLEAFNNSYLPVSKTLYKYDSKGRLAKQETTSYRSKSVQVTTYAYDGNGYLIEEKTQRGNGPLAKIAYKNNGKGLKLKQTGSNSENDNVVVWNYAYDAGGNMTEAYTNDGLGSRYTYNDKNKLIEEVSYTPKGVSNRQEYEYNDAGNMTEQKLYDAQNNLMLHTTYSYTYDEKNSWVECTVTKNGVVTEAKERVYVYY